MAQAHLYISAAFALLLLAFAPRAGAWEVCNETSYILRVATAVTTDGALVPKGWSRARPGECLSVEAAENTPRYVYAESARAHQGGIREWKGNTPLCASQDDFKSNTDITCPLQGLETRGYLAVDPSEQKTSFVEAQDFGSKAQTAGLQRLLRDNGYRVAKVDGQTGRQTQRALEKFLDDNELDKSRDINAKIDALEQAALAREDEVGIKICNESSGRIWTAIAYRNAASWESRGWWPVEIGACLRPHTASIKAYDAHIFALLEVQNEEDYILKSTAAVPSQYCVAESRFAVLGRESCKDRGYTPASFRPLATDQDGVSLTLDDNDFAPRKKGGLRQ